MSDPALLDRSPKEVAEALVAIHDPAWLRSVVTYIDRALRKQPLDRLMTLWGLSAAEAAELFGVTRQAFSKWLQSGPPVERGPAVAALADATDALERHLKRERIPVVVRRRAEGLDNESLLELAAAGKYEQVLAATRSMFDVRRIQP